MTNYLRALAFLTIIPLPFVRFGPDGRELSHSATFFPLAGATIGLLLTAVTWLLLHIFPAGVVVAVVLALNFFLTRGLHLDGLADTADGLIGTTDRAKAFKAMDDSAVGVMGAVSIFLVYLAKFALLIEFNIFVLPFVLFFMPLAGRLAIVYAGAWFAPARDQGLGDMFLRDLRWPILLKASLLTALLFFIFAWWYAPLVVAVIGGCLLALAAAHLLSFYASRRLGGITGDILGASCELGEMFFLFGFYLALQQSSYAGSLAKAVVNYVQGF